MFFDYFRTTVYGGVDLVEISQRVAFFEDVLKDDILCSDYEVEDGETPQQVAQDFYGDPEMDWTIFYLNNIIDPMYDWLMDTNLFEMYLKEKYTNPEDTAYWITSDGRRWDADKTTWEPYLPDNEKHLAVEAKRVSLREMEEEKNNEKRRIRVINPNRLYIVVDEFKKLMRKNG